MKAGKEAGRQACRQTSSQTTDSVLGLLTGAGCHLLKWHCVKQSRLRVECAQSAKGAVCSGHNRAVEYQDLATCRHSQLQTDICIVWSLEQCLTQAP